MLRAKRVFTGVSTFCHVGQPPLPAMHWASRPKIRNPRERSRKKKLYSVVSSTYIPPTPAKRTEKPNPACYNANGKPARAATVRERFPPLRAQSEQKVWGQASGTSKLGQATWRASPDVPCRHSWRHVFAGTTTRHPCRPRVSQSVSDKNKQNPTKNSHFVRQYDTGPAAALNANH